MKQLHDYQELAVKQLKNGSILCGGVGSGKSVTALAYYLKVCGFDPSNPTVMREPLDLYIITTAKKRDSNEWNKECSEYYLDGYSMDGDENCNPSGVRISIDSWNNVNRYVGVKNAFFIFDEQKTVGSGLWAKSFIKIAHQNKWIMLSATPGDTWTDYISVFLANNFYRTRTEFYNEHVVMSRFSKYPKIERFINCGKLVNLKNRILVDMDYIRPTTIHEKYIYTDYDKEKMRTIQIERKNPFADMAPIENASQYYYLMRKCVNSSKSRRKKLIEIIKENPKLIIFYNFDYELDILREVGEELKITVAELNGHKHEPIPQDDNWIYLIQYASGSEGINCIETNTVLFFSQSYSYKQTVQAMGRVDRNNTPYTDLYGLHLTSNSFIDYSIYKSHLAKKAFNESDSLDDESIFDEKWFMD